MKVFLSLALLSLLLSGCGNGKLKELLHKSATDSALCSGLAKPIDDLTDALLVDGGPRSVVAGEVVITGFDSGCSE